MSPRLWLRRQSPALLLFLTAVAVAPLSAEDARLLTRAEESEARMKRDVFFLASDECEGRGPTTAGLVKAGDYIAAEFKKAGLKPGNPDGTYFQNFTISGARKIGPATLVLKGPAGREIVLREGVHFDAMGIGSAGKLTDVPVVFAGYGISNKTMFGPAYDDYAGLDVKGKVVIVLRDVPRTTNRFAVPDMRFGGFRAFGSLTRKLGTADENGAAAVLFVNDADTARTGDDLLDFDYTAVGSAPSRNVPDPDKPGKLKPIPVNLPALHVKRDVLDQMLNNCVATDLATIEADIDRDMRPHTAELKGWTVSLEMATKRDKLPLRNVIGVLEGRGPLANETVVIGAHYDHLGYGGSGSLARLKKRAIHHGADDNGSGTTAVMELARRFAAMPDREGRRLVFMAFSGEELGLLGSEYYVNHPLYPLKNTSFMLNLDMVGRLRPADIPKRRDFFAQWVGTRFLLDALRRLSERDCLLAEGLGTGKDFKKLVDDWNKTWDLDLKKTDAAVEFSDHYSFYAKKVPVLFFWTDYHDDYHKPSDTADKINVPGMRRVVELSQGVLAYFTTQTERPVWQEVKSTGGGRPGRDGPTLGFVPQFGGDDGVGVKAVREGGPGSKAGLMAGDKIVEVAGQPIRNLEGYAQTMSTLKPGAMIDVVVVRDGSKVTLKVKLDQ
jgi:hypothetical protein